MAYSEPTLRLPGLILRLRSGQAAWACLSKNSRPRVTAEGLRVDPERRSLPRLKRRGLPSTRAQAEGAPPNGSTPLNENLLYALKRVKLSAHPAYGGTGHSAVLSKNGVPIA